MFLYILSLVCFFVRLEYVLLRCGGYVFGVLKDVFIIFFEWILKSLNFGVFYFLSFIFLIYFFVVSSCENVFNGVLLLLVVIVKWSMVDGLNGFCFDWGECVFGVFEKIFFGLLLFVNCIRGF